MRKIIDNKIFKIIYGTIKAIVVCVLVIYIGFLALQRFSNNDSIMGYRVFTVATGSMKPEYDIGDVILVEDIDYEDLKIGDIITYESKAAGNEGMIITHRIIDLNHETKELITQGDANDVEDPVIDSDQVYGKVTREFVVIGALTKLIRNKIGFYFLIFVPLVLVIFLEIADIVTQVRDEENEEASE